MSDQPPSGPTEPVPPASSGAPQPDQAAPGQPGFAAPGQPGFAAPGQPDPAASGQPGFPAPGQPGYPGGQPAGAYPADPAGQPHGWSWPAPAGGSPADPHGWSWPHPAYPGQPAGMPPGLDPDDPLVPPPYAGFAGWSARCSGVLRRGWRQLLPIVLLGQGLPAAVIAVLTLWLTPTGQPVTSPTGATTLPDGYLRDFSLLYGAVLLAVLLFGPLQSAGWAAGTWVVTRQAAGEPAGVGAAFRYGWRRAIGLWGWSLVASLLMMVGFCACFLPGIYVMFAVALFGPVYLFERQDPIGRSFGIFHKRFGPVLGRVSLVVAALLLTGGLNALLDLLGQAAFGLDPMAAPGTAVGAVLLALVGVVLAVPGYLVQLIALLVTYTEQRAHEGPVNTARLAAELG
ncbi:hypothetical protein [Micromonospora auratinigra]|uniref:Membrane domain of glycerophosphoryl diester phosphodiesterase n=1 Tax=Micromonospora auratinigra TaxID=261654 RepID=A0A1A8ZXC3_9ACTN|nr:hypothetical protein [Micromonospora auratinigra]SBT48575.1 hypothetical protein GA0070611_4109 [Micromonospora auratinigra]